MIFKEHIMELTDVAKVLLRRITDLLDNKKNMGLSHKWDQSNREMIYFVRKMEGNIIDGGSIENHLSDSDGNILRNDNGFVTVITLLDGRFHIEWTDVIDVSLANSLLKHISYRFPETVHFKTWQELSPDNISPAIRVKLSLLVRTGNFGLCTDCSVCSTLKIKK